MKYADIGETMRLVIGGREAFRKMGFRAEDLYLKVNRSMLQGGLMSAFVVLQAQGKEFTLECGPVPKGDGEAFIAEYKRVSEAINSGTLPDADLERIFEESEPYQDKIGFGTALAMKGFRAPKSLS